LILLGVDGKPSLSAMSAPVYGTISDVKSAPQRGSRITDSGTGLEKGRAQSVSQYMK
jgi:hypothetical protein